MFLPILTHHMTLYTFLFLISLTWQCIISYSWSVRRKDLCNISKSLSLTVINFYKGNGTHERYLKQQIHTHVQFVIYFSSDEQNEQTQEDNLQRLYLPGKIISVTERKTSNDRCVDSVNLAYSFGNSYVMPYGFSLSISVICIIRSVEGIKKFFP